MKNKEIFDLLEQYSDAVFDYGRDMTKEELKYNSILTDKSEQNKKSSERIYKKLKYEINLLFKVDKK
jgi:hypothetical protein